MNLPTPTSVLGKRSLGEIEQGVPEPSKLFQCSECGKSYTRVDHLARHVRLHTKEKPYPCTICGKAFSRADLLKRHIAGHDARGDHEQARRIPLARLGRVSKACEACAELHMKCDEQKPCTRCKKKQLTCLYNATPLPETEAAAGDLSSSAHDTGTTETAFIDDSTIHDDASVPTQLVEPFSGNRSNRHHLLDGMDFDTAESYSLDPAQEGTIPSDSYGADNQGMHDFLKNIMGGGETTLPALPGHTLGTWTPRFDFGQDTNLELSDLDLGFLNDYNLQNPFAAYLESPETTQSRTSATGNFPPVLGVESLQKASTWRFRPVTRDSSSDEQHHLSLPEAETNKKLLVDRRMTAEALSYNMRDRILAVILASCKPGNVPRSVLCFPSLELLDSLLQYYLTCKYAVFNGLFHLPTLRPSKLRPELVASMIAAGASLTPDTSLQKVGFALQEALRITVPQLFENNNALIADLQCLQSMGLCLSIGLWSGNSRKMEMAESFLQPYVTMARRRGWFLRSAYDLETALTLDDHGKQLEDKWNAWIELETRKRLVFFYFLHGTRQSLSLLTNPLVSYAELGLPLPADRSLWLAPSAIAWKNAYLGRSQSRATSLADLLHDVDLLAESQTSFDPMIASEVVLSAAWGLIWDYRQTCSITKGQSTQWSSSDLLLSSRLAELNKLLECIAISAPSCPMIKMLLELLRMHLYVPLDEVHVFAGADGHEEARRVYPQLQEWAKTSGAREAAAHAAQVVAAARKMGQSCLRDFWAIAVYQAGLTLWSYGVIYNSTVVTAGTESGPSPSVRKRTESIAVLDGPHSSGVQRFIALNRGQGAIGGTAVEQANSHHVLLSDPGAVMGVLVELFKVNHRSQQSLPPLVSNLTSLMEGLQTAVTG
ncbi:hypothetical protein BDV97DRAFT_349879 [Delphinella strobiligena]|nr:hypothetical protein BDV97DRAFT_349879 [Delphinella strobiligena]